MRITVEAHGKRFKTKRWQLKDQRVESFQNKKKKKFKKILESALRYQAVKYNWKA